MDIIEKHAKSLELLRQNPIIMRKLSEYFKDADEITVPTLTSIAENKNLFLKFIRSDFDKYHCLGKALDRIRDDQILICFSDLKLYAIVDSMDKLKEFRSNARCLLEDENGLHICVTQVVLNYQRQKLVFVIHSESPEIVTKICETAEKYLLAKTTTNILDQRTEVTIDDKIMENREHAQKIYDQLYTCVYDELSDFADIIRMLPVMMKSSKNFTTPDISKVITDNDNWMSNLKSSPSKFEIQITNNITNNIVINNNYVAPKKDKKKRLLSG